MQRSRQPRLINMLHSGRLIPGTGSQYGVLFPEMPGIAAHFDCGRVFRLPVFFDSFDCFVLLMCVHSTGQPRICREYGTVLVDESGVEMPSN